VSGLWGAVGEALGNFVGGSVILCLEGYSVG